MSTKAELPRTFRKMEISRRRESIAGLLGAPSPDWDGLPPDSPLLELADRLIESAAGMMTIPLGILRSININHKNYILPMVTEEPSVVAAANFGAFVINRRGETITASGAPSLMNAHLYIESPPPGLAELLKQREERLIELLSGPLDSMTARGGGLKGIHYKEFREINQFRIELEIDVCDAQGANLLNTTAETLKAYLIRKLNLSVFLAILSNNAPRRLGKARFSLPLERLARGSFPGKEIGRRICLASETARVDPDRAVTHNKGIMNGVTALALATGNDTRALEAAAHAYASSGGEYRGLSRYTINGDRLEGFIELPIPLGSVGGSVNYHPLCRDCLKLMGNPGARELASLAAALGLAQNFAALYALVSEGIQQGHMRLHNRRKP